MFIMSLRIKISIGITGESSRKGVDVYYKY